MPRRNQQNRRRWKQPAQQRRAQQPGQPNAHHPQQPQRQQSQQLPPSPQHQVQPPLQQPPRGHEEQVHQPHLQHQSEEERQQPRLRQDGRDKETIPVHRLVKGAVVLCPVEDCQRPLAEDFTQASFAFVFDKHLKDVIDSEKGKRKKLIVRFLKMVNTLMNEGGGVIYIHTHQHLLNFWDQQVDDNLMELVPDGTIFEENFERHVIEEHVIFRVKPGQSGLLSTLDFHSKTSLNKGLSDPTHTQMKHLLTRPYPKKVGAREMLFDPATLKQGDWVTFHENRNMQAKVVYEKDLDKKTPKKIQGRAPKLLHYWWGFLELPNYIAAFAKQCDGGSYYLGLKEEKTEYGPRWKLLPNTQGLWDMLETDIQCWIDDRETDKKIFHLAKEEDVPKHEVRSGHFKCEGIPLTEKEKQELEEQLDEKIRSHLPRQPRDDAANARQDKLVELKFHPVCEADGADNAQEADGAGNAQEANGGEQGAQQCPPDSKRYVVEVRINYYHGVCFHDKQGPEAYRFDHKNRPSRAVRLTMGQWLEAQA